MRLPPLEVSDGASERARLRAEYFAIHAAETTTVREFRRRVIAQKRPFSLVFPATTQSQEDAEYATVSSEMARAFLSSPAIALLTVEDFEAMGRSVIEGLEGIRVTDVRNDEEIVRFTVHLEHEGREPIERQFSFPESTALQLDPRMDWTVRLLGREAVLLRRGSVFDELRLLSESLSLEFPWRPWDAAWFALTGEPPMRPLIETSITTKWPTGPEYPDARITLSIDATLSPDEVASHYAKVRDELLGGTRIRRAETRTLEVFRFVNSRRLRTPILTWGELVREWDRTHPEEWGFGGNEKAFRLYWRRGLRSVFPEFRAHPTPRADEKEQS